MNEALKPVEASESHKKVGYKYDCPRCHYALGFKEKREGASPRWMRKTVLYEMYEQYCWFCGQQIDWS